MQREATRFHLTIVALGPVGASIDEAIALVPGLSALRPGAPLRRAGWKRSDFFFDLPGGHDGLGIHVTVRAVLRESDSVPIERHVSDCDGVVCHLDTGKFTTVEVPLFLDAGWKPIPNVFVGAYGGLAGGGAGSGMATCGQGGASCTSVTLSAGLEAQVHFLAYQRFNPWAGYGIGYSATNLSVTPTGSSTKSTYGLAGWDFAHFMVGVDFRPTRLIGVGPYADVASASTRTGGARLAL